MKITLSLSYIPKEFEQVEHKGKVITVTHSRENDSIDNLVEMFKVVALGAGYSHTEIDKALGVKK